MFPPDLSRALSYQLKSPVMMIAVEGIKIREENQSKSFALQD